MTAAERCAAIRRTIIRLSHQANSAHLGSSLSCVEILDAVLEASDLRPDTAGAALRDRVIISKGHAAMAAYATLAANGLLDPALLDTYLADGSALWGHVSVSPHAPAIDYSAGSLGHGLGIACGLAYGHRLKGADQRVWCVLSDGECDEGSIWEAALFAGHHRLDGLTAVIDYNKIQSLDFCREVMDLEPLADKWRAFRWQVEEVDGHDRAAVFDAVRRRADQPRVIVAHTVKGKGIPRIENTVASHYKPALAGDLDHA